MTGSGFASVSTDTTALIVGGGPAGMAAALSLRQRGIEVSVLEAGDYGAEAAADTLRADGRHILALLGIAEDRLAGCRAPGRGIDAVWADEKPTSQVLGGDGASWHLMRPAFDGVLADSAAAAGASIAHGTSFQSVAQDGSGWRVTASGAEGRIEVRARYLIDATGRASRVAQRLGERRIAFDRLVAGWAYLVPPSGPIASSRLLLEADADGWWYSAPQADGRILLSLVTDADLWARSGSELWQEGLARSHYTRRRVGLPTSPQELRLRAASVGRLGRAAGDGWLAVGDAAVSLDPLCGAGLVHALSTGIAAGEAVAGALSGDRGAFARYADSLLRGFARHLSDRTRYYGHVDRFAQRLFWKRRRPPEMLGRLHVEPTALLRASGRRSRESMARLESLLALRDVAALRASWAEPTEAHRIVADLKRKAAAPIDDSGAIATLQRLIVDHALEFAGE